MEIAAGIAIGLVAGVPLTLGGTYYLWVLQRKTRRLAYEILSANVLIPGPPESTPDIKILVRNELIDPGTRVGDLFSEVDQVMGFRVLLRNTGNEPLEEQVVTLDLEEPAVTLSASIESQPDLGHRSIVVEKQIDGPHRTRITMPFLNPGQEIIASLQSIRNEANACRVSAGAPGLDCYDLRRRRTRNYVLFAGALAVIAVITMAIATTVAIIYMDNDTRPIWASATLWSVVPVFIVSMFLLSVRGRER